MTIIRSLLLVCSISILTLSTVAFYNQVPPPSAESFRHIHDLLHGYNLENFFPAWSSEKYLFNIGRFKNGYFYMLNDLQVRDDSTMLQILLKSSPEIETEVAASESKPPNPELEVTNSDSETANLEPEIINSPPKIAQLESENKLQTPPSQNAFPNPVIKIGASIYPALRIEFNSESNTNSSVAQIYFPTIIGQKGYLFFTPNFDSKVTVHDWLFDLSIGRDARGQGSNIWALLIILSILILVVTIFSTLMSTSLRHTSQKELSDSLIDEIKKIDQAKKGMLENIDRVSFWSNENNAHKEIRRSSAINFFDKAQDLTRIIHESATRPWDSLPHVL